MPTDEARIRALTEAVQRQEQTEARLEKQIAEQNRKLGDAAKAAAKQAAAHKKEAQTNVRWRKWLTRFLVFDVAVTVAVTFNFLDVRTLTHCQAEVSAQSQESLAARSQFADVITDSDLEFLDATEKVIQDTPNGATQARRDAARAEWLAAIQRKREALLQSKQVRAENPVVKDHRC